MMKKVFVYGSMSQGMVHFDKIKHAVENVIPAKLIAAAYQLSSGYPIIIKEGMDEVPGHVVELKSPDMMIPVLDEFFGASRLDTSKGLHLRESAWATLVDQNEPVEVWVYFLNPKKLPSQAKKIRTEDWSNALNAPKFIDQLTDRQKMYLRKLGQITGRESVPVDLSLYRELMSLELIVDKGRRLALSKFGQEVYRYLGEATL
ncbi:MAG: gamma-glutamylcyclotransferase [Bdellovibrionales bacterium]